MHSHGDVGTKKMGYSGSHLFYAKLWTVCSPKTYGKKDMEKIWKIKGWSALLPKNQKEYKNPSGSYHNHLPPFLRTLGCFDFTCAQLRVVELTTAYAEGSVRTPCLMISGSGVRCAANARHYRGLHIRFPWSKRSRSVVSSHFRLILSREIMVHGPSSFF